MCGDYDDDVPQDLAPYRSSSSPHPSSHPIPTGPPPGFPMVPNSVFSHSFMYMSHYIPSMHNAATAAQLNSVAAAAAAASSGGGAGPGGPPVGLNLTALSPDERRKRNRTFIDPVTEVPRLEQWFGINTHPSHNLILKYTDELNNMLYRQKFPRLEPKNVQFWFKNRRAKNKRMKISMFDGQQANGAGRTMTPSPGMNHLGFHTPELMHPTHSPRE